jgi:hypothetical protein
MKNAALPGIDGWLTRSVLIESGPSHKSNNEKNEE